MRKGLCIANLTLLLGLAACGGGKQTETIMLADAYWENDSMAFREIPVRQAGDGYELEGVYTLPARNLPVPLLLMPSSGDADLTSGEAKPFRDLARGLARQGIATYRFSNRAYVLRDSAASAVPDIPYKEMITGDVIRAYKQANVFERLDTTQIYLVAPGSFYLPDLIANCPRLKGVVLYCAPARPIEMTYLEVVRNLARKDSAWQRTLLQVEKQTRNLENLGTANYVAAVGLPFGWKENNWKELKGYSCSEAVKSISLPVYVLYGREEATLPQTEFDIWEQTFRNNPRVTCKQYKNLASTLLPPSDKLQETGQTGPAHVPSYVITDLAGWIHTSKNVQ